MIPKNSGRTYWKAMVLVLLLIIPGVGHSSNYPQWLQAYHDGALKLTEVYYGVGSADFIEGSSEISESKRQSKDRALDELCYQLSVSIKSEFKEKLVQKGQHVDQDIASSLFVSTKKVFSGIRVKDSWTDIQNSVYWVMVVIDKAEADRQVKQQDFIKEVVDRLANNQEEIAAGMKKMTAVLIQQGKINEARFDELKKFMKTIDKKVGSGGDQTKAEYTGIKSEINNLGNKWNKQEEMLRDQNKKMEVLMSQNKALQELLAKISNKIHEDHFLALTQDDVKNQSKNPAFTVTITPLKGQGVNYYDGESIRFRVQASRDCYVKVIYLSSISDEGAGETRMNTLLFPNPHDPNNFIRGGETVIIGKMGELVAQTPYGKDIVTVVASQSQFTDIQESLRKAVASGQYYHNVTRNVGDVIRSRGIGVAPPGSVKTSPTTGSFVSDTCFIVTRKRN
jgi:hypothetical protein